MVLHGERGGTRKETMMIGRLVRHFEQKHEEPLEELLANLRDTREQHPTRSTLELLELIHNRQHTSLDWDAGHPEDEVQ